MKLENVGTELLCVLRILSIMIVRSHRWAPRGAQINVEDQLFSQMLYILFLLVYKLLSYWCLIYLDRNIFNIFLKCDLLDKI